MSINVKIKRINPETETSFPKDDMCVWLTEQAFSELGLSEKLNSKPNFIRIESKEPICKFTMYAPVVMLDSYQDGYIWIPSKIIHKSVMFGKDTLVEITPIDIDDNSYCVAESVIIKLNEQDVELWSEEEVEKAKKIYLRDNFIVFDNQCVFVKPLTKSTVIGVVENIWPKPKSFSQLFIIDRETTKINFEGLSANMQKVIDFNQIGGLDTLITKLREILQLPMTCPDALTRFGIKPPKGMLMYGPPGTGKTMIARAVAQSMGSAFISIQGPEILSKYVGGGEYNLRDKFAEAESKGNSVLFIDEIDAIASARNDIDKNLTTIVAQLLTCMDGLNRNNVFVIGATNRINAIDPAFRRPGRFDLEFEVPLPAANARFDILQKYVHLEKADLYDEKVSSKTLKKLADLTNGYSGADLSSLYRETAMNALRKRIHFDFKTGKMETTAIESTKIAEDDFFEAMKHIIPTSRRDADVAANVVLWDDLLCIDDAKRQLIDIHSKLEKFTSNDNITNRPSFANFIVNGKIGSGKKTLISAFASRFGYELIKIDFAKLMASEQFESFNYIEKQFTRAKAVAPALIELVNYKESDKVLDLLDKILAETSSVNKYSKVLLVLVVDNEQISDVTKQYIGYKKFHSTISIQLPTDAMCGEVLKKYNLDESLITTFAGQPVGQMLSSVNEYIISKE